MAKVQESHAAERSADNRSVLVPLVDQTRDGRVYHRSLAIFASLGMALGALLLGWLGWALAVGTVSVAGLGQWSASGAAVATFTGAGIGAASGALVGGLIALYRLPARPGHTESTNSEEER